MDRLSNLYQLLAKLFLGPINQDFIRLLRDLPVIEGFLRESFPDAQTDAALTDALAIESYRVFGLQVFPFAGCFCSTEDWIGTVTAHQVALKYEASGFRVPTLDSERADHIGHELLFLSFLLRRELQNADPGYFRAAQKKFLESDVLPWILPLVIAITQQHSFFFTQTANLLLSTLIFHRESLGINSSIPTDLVPTGSEVDPEKFLNSPETGFNEIVEHLLRPGFSGIYLSMAFISETMRCNQVPAGFGDRKSLMHELFSSGTQFEKIHEILGGLLQFVDSWYDNLLDQPEALIPYCKGWLQNNRNTRVLLTNMQLKIAR
jgi:hypothetical protein